MSRMLGFGILFVDAISSAALLLHSSLTAVAVVLMVVTSGLFTLGSTSIRSLIWPRYFWDDAEASASD